MPVQILALETSSARCGVALLRHDAGLIQIVERHHDGVAEHSARLLGLVDAVLAEAGATAAALNAVAYGQGPGGFTGLRVACGVAQGLGFSLGLPLVPVVTHQALELALPAAGSPWRLVLQDARMGEVYAAVLQRQPGAAVATLVAGPVLVSLAHVASWLSSVGVLAQASGNAGWVASDLPAEARTAVAMPTDWLWHDAVLQPEASAVARAAWVAWQGGARVSPEQAQPLYVRDKVAFTTAERALGAGGNPRAPLPAALGAD